MINLRNGTKRSRSYEDSPMYFDSLRRNIQASREAQRQTSCVLVKMMKELISDYREGLISQDVVWEYLKAPKSFFENSSAPHPEALNSEQLNEWIDEYGPK